MFVVKNMLQLIRNVQSGAEYAYGTTLSFRHVPSAFDEDSRILLRVLERNAADKYVAFMPIEVSHKMPLVSSKK